MARNPRRCSVDTASGAVGFFSRRARYRSEPKISTRLIPNFQAVEIATCSDLSGPEIRNCCMTTKLNLRGNWNEVKGKLKQKYGQLTDDDLTFASGKEDEWLGKLQQKLGLKKEDLRSEIEKL